MGKGKIGLFNQSMSWLKVTVFALITAVITALVKLVPQLDGTSFQDIAVNLEAWILFAVIIAVNCNKWWEASLKVFVFFLISQPLIYLIQVPFSSMGFGLFGYYKYWFMVTVLTLPGGAIAWLVKKRNWLSVFVLSVATGFLGYAAAIYFWNVRANFPYHIISMIFCPAVIVLFIFGLLKNKGHRIVATVIVIVVIGVSVFMTNPDSSKEIYLPSGSWSYTVDNVGIADITVDENGKAIITAIKDGTACVEFKNDNGEIEEYVITVSNHGVYTNKMEN